MSGNGDYFSDPFEPTEAGTYRWIANYGGDANNKATHNMCNAANENVIVQPAESAVMTSQSLIPNDTAYVTGASFTPTGPVTFSLYDNPGCMGSPVYTQQSALAPTLNLKEASAFTTNTGLPIVGFTATGDGTWYWKVSYEGDINNEPSESACGVERFTVENNHQGP